MKNFDIHIAFRGVLIGMFVLGLWGTNHNLSKKIDSLNEYIRLIDSRSLDEKCARLGGVFYERGSHSNIWGYTGFIEDDTCVKNETSYIWSEWRGGFYNVKEKQEVTPLK